MNERTQPEASTDSSADIDTTALPLQTSSEITFASTESLTMLTIEPDKKSTTSGIDYYSSTSAATITNHAAQSSTTATFTDSSVTDDITEVLTTADQMSSTDYLATSSAGSDASSTSKSPEIISSAETTTEQSFLTTETTEASCIEKVWFIPQEEKDLHYDVIKKNCAEKASENNATFGYPAFLNSDEEFDQYKSSVPHRKEYIGRGKF